MDKKIVRFSIRSKKYNDKYLKDFYLREEIKKKAGAFNIQRPSLKKEKKKDVFMSAKIDKITKVKPEIRPALKSMQ